MTRWTKRQKLSLMWLMIKEACAHPLGVSHFWPEADGKTVRITRGELPPVENPLIEILEFAPDEIDYILDGFDGHEFDEAASRRGMEMGCIACCQIAALRSLRVDVVKALAIIRRNNGERSTKDS